MYPANERVIEEEWLDELAAGASELGLEESTIAVASELYLAELPLENRSKQATLAASCYTAALITGNQRSQTTVANAFAVSRLSIQQRWKAQLESVGFDAPSW